MAKFNDLVLANGGWRNYLGLLNPGSWWDYKKRGIGGDAKYPGNFIPEIARQLIPRLSKRGDFVADLFAGSETTAHVCGELGREYVGCDLRPISTRTDKADARIWNPGVKVQLSFLHPPYANIIDYNKKFGPEAGDLSLPHSDFLKEFKVVAENVWNITEDNGYAVLVIADLWDSANREHLMLGFYTATVMMLAGWKPKQVNVKNFGSEVANKGKNAHLWFLRALTSDFCILEHEYIFVFKKESKGCPSIKSFLGNL